MPAGQTMRRTRSARAPAGFAFLPRRLARAVAALLVTLVPTIAPVCVRADAPAPAARSYTRAYLALGAGAALTGVSFVLAEGADRDYARYLAETDPSRLEDAYQSARRKDRLSAATLVAGQAGLALGVYWRFLRRAAPRAEARRADWRLSPRLDREGVGIAVDARF